MPQFHPVVSPGPEQRIQRVPKDPRFLSMSPPGGEWFRDLVLQVVLVFPPYRSNIEELRKRRSRLAETLAPTQAPIEKEGGSNAQMEESQHKVELSMTHLDLAMILGTAHGLNLLLGLDLLTCVFLTIVDAILFPLFSACLENGKGKLLCIYLASFILLVYVFGVLICQPEIPLSMGGMLSKLCGESAWALMSLLGASIHPCVCPSYLLASKIGP
ncbi:hypothetical protein LguiB_028228 [Lonicera macranthoides]